MPSGYWHKVLPADLTCAPPRLKAGSYTNRTAVEPGCGFDSSVG